MSSASLEKDIAAASTSDIVGTDLKSNLKALPRRLSVRKQSAVAEGASSSNASGTPPAPDVSDSAVPASPPTAPAATEPAPQPATPVKPTSAAVSDVAAAHPPPKRSPSVRFSSNNLGAQPSSASSTPPDTSSAGSPTTKSALRNNHNHNKNSGVGSTAVVVAAAHEESNNLSLTAETKEDIAEVQRQLLAEAEAEALDFVFGDMLAFEALSVGSGSKWFWGIGREVIAAFKKGTTENLLSDEAGSSGGKNGDGSANADGRKVTARQMQAQRHEAMMTAKRAMRVQLWEVESNEAVLSPQDRAHLAASRRTIAASTAQLHQLSSRQRELEDASKSAQLSIEALEVSLQTDWADIYSLLEGARKAVGLLSSASLAEIRAYTRPPIVVRQVLLLVVTLLGSAPPTSEMSGITGGTTNSAGSSNNSGSGGGATARSKQQQQQQQHQPGAVEVNWETVRERIRDGTFVRDVRDFEPAMASTAALEAVQAKMDEPGFTYDRCSKASAALGPLHQWLAAILACAAEARRSKAFYDLSRQIGGHRERAKAFAAALEGLGPKIVAAERALGDAEAEVDRLLFGGKLDFLRGAPASFASTRTATVSSSPFEGLSFVPAQPASCGNIAGVGAGGVAASSPFFGGIVSTLMLRSSCRSLGPLPPMIPVLDEAAKTPYAVRPPAEKFVLTDEIAAQIREAFQMPKPKPIVTAATAAVAVTATTGGGGKAANKKGHGAAAGAGSRTSSQQPTPRTKSNQPSGRAPAAAAAPTGAAKPSTTAATTNKPVPTPTASQVGSLPAITTPRVQQQAQAASPSASVGAASPGMPASASASAMRSPRLQHLTASPGSVMAHLASPPASAPIDATAAPSPPQRQPASTVRSNPKQPLAPIKS